MLLLPSAAQTGELPVLRRTFADPTQPPPPFADGSFDPRQGETIAFLGGTDTFEQDRHSWVELAFHLAWPDRDLHLRNLAWQGDTVFEQARPLYFYTQSGDPQPGSIPDHRERTEPGIIFIHFGKMESLEGTSNLPRFLAAYSGLLDQLLPLTGRLVLVAPPPFFPAGPAESHTAARNNTLATFAAAIQSLAQERNLLFLDLFTPLLPDLDPGLSSNGVHLNATGHRAVAELMATQLHFPLSIPDGIPTGSTGALWEAIAHKNRLWQQYYRPPNWAFLFGDRQHVPASRDPVERDQRWFVREIDALPGLIAVAEATLHHCARQAASP